ncbi:MAG TPA: type II toxin-antitoxin system VapC family toxin [Solirubrobacteraceae bacterium]
MKLLLDTHAALWWLSGDERFSDHATQQLTDDRNQVMLSAAVVWEVAVKRSLGKLEAPPNFASTLLDGGAQPLHITLDHASAVEKLPWHHRDPFDRLLIAQALFEDAALVSKYAVLAHYGVRVVW